MEKHVAVPCVVAAKPLWQAPYALALVRISPQEQKLVWAEKKDIVLDSQSPTADELSATIKARLLREEKDLVVVVVHTRGIPAELSVTKALLKTKASSP